MPYVNMWIVNDTIVAGIVTLNLYIFLSDYDISWKIGYIPKNTNLYLWALVCVNIISYNCMPRNNYYPLCIALLSVYYMPGTTIYIYPSI